jgi:predicted transposase YbfD/YdcC
VYAYPMLQKWTEWGVVQRVIRVTRWREVRGKAQTVSVNYYLSNRDLPAQTYGNSIRAHWSIENQSHYVRDTAFLEDHTHKRINPFIFASCIDFALNLLRRAGIHNIRQALYKTSLDFQHSFNHLKHFL